MKVYLLKFIDAHDCFVEGVYTSRELAEKKLLEHPELYEGHSADFLANVADKKLYQDKISIEAHRGIYDYLWYFENKLK